MEINNETLGQAVEKVICDISGLESTGLKHRSNLWLEERVTPIIQEALNKLPPIVKHVGLERGTRGGQSKSTIDFICKNEETISVKTTKNRSFKLCPSECGQPGAETFDRYFGHLYYGSITPEKFKRIGLEKAHKMMPVYLKHLFDCDYLLLVYIDSPDDGFHIFTKTDIPNIKWNPDEFNFTKNIHTWNESCTVKYKGISIGEFQVHQHRSSYKFRFHILNLIKALELLGSRS